jgi:hypothetical protein
MKDTYVIAIKDAPLIDSKQFGHKLQAYRRGDIFKVHSIFSDQVVIWNKILESTIACNIENFEILSEHRNKQLNKIL